MVKVAILLLVGLLPNNQNARMMAYQFPSMEACNKAQVEFLKNMTSSKKVDPNRVQATCYEVTFNIGN